jgi:uncharacterized phage protein (TIGR02218 family)
MTRKWLSTPLETMATYWQIFRRDGVALGFTSHDRDLWFDGMLHRAAPGMMPAAIRRTAGFEADSAEVQGAISHEAISRFDLQAGRYDSAVVVVGVVDWQSLEHQRVYRGSMGTTSEDADGFVAELQSRKAELARDPVPRTSPTCRADFCGKACGLSGWRFEHEGLLTAHDQPANSVMVAGAASAEAVLGGLLRWMDGPYAGMAMGIIGLKDGALLLDQPLDVALSAGLRVILREGCDHTLPTCAERFANAVNFQGEPFLPGNDLVVRYGLSS